MNVDIEKAAELLLKDLETFKGDGVEKQIAVMHLYRTFQAGKNVDNWWEHMDEDPNYSFKADDSNGLEPFDYDFYKPE